MSLQDLAGKLNAIHNVLQRVAGRSPIFIDGAVTGRTIKTLWVNDAAVFTTITGASGTNYVALWGISGKTINQGAVLNASDDDPIVAVTPASGSAIGYE